MYVYVYACNLFYQRRFDLVIPPFFFSLLCHSILNDWERDYDRPGHAFGNDAIEALQTAAESFIVEKFEERLTHNS
jgi:hypothetical protein